MSYVLAKFQHYITAIKKWNDQVSDERLRLHFRRHHRNIRVFRKLRPYLFILAVVDFLVACFLTPIYDWVRFVTIGVSLIIIAFCLYFPYWKVKYNRDNADLYRRLMNREITP